MEPNIEIVMTVQEIFDDGTIGDPLAVQKGDNIFEVFQMMALELRPYLSRLPAFDATIEVRSTAPRRPCEA
jgi:hypothetical protein